MKVRFPRFDSSRFRARWAPNPEFAQYYNAFSIVPAHIEPYLVKVMMRARKQLDPKYTQLDADMEVFIRQETQHCKQHVAFNQFMYDAGYEVMRKIEADYKADYHRFLTQRSLRFNINSYTRRCADALLAIDRQCMSPEQLKRSKEREQRQNKLIGRASLRRLVKVLLPWYNPKHKPMPQNMRELLERYAATPAA